MRRLLAILGGFLLGIALIAVGAGIAAYRSASLERSSKSYLKTNLPPIVSVWSTEALLERATPDLLDRARQHPGELQKTFQALSTLGALEHIDEPKGHAAVLIPTSAGKRLGVDDVVTVKYQHGQAQITLWLIKMDGDWKFQKFSAQATLLQQPATLSDGK